MAANIFVMDENNFETAENIFVTTEQIFGTDSNFFVTAENSFVTTEQYFVIKKQTFVTKPAIYSIPEPYSAKGSSFVVKVIKRFKMRQIKIYCKFLNISAKNSFLFAKFLP